MTEQVNSFVDGILDPKGEGKSVAIDSANFDAAMLNILEVCTCVISDVRHWAV